ncbi:ABC-2 type transport system ATP-binding protein [Bifidobacterium bohemicum]|uniref:ATP-driven polysaccharide export protein n=1 Tax=Bifidobacterium bohemicum DSM 22767 TaxID=1437606 RepID=A0A086ZHP5_9BIFI|nr:ABC transporter ATP-binding protein [Bifidobacterium bohemicum]KFI46045.1 ATP-driven polysaccharide export protein [Bifidobacterium bohemicum DSM 22767]SCC05571.1 ABC-2 type transport system ATP-binding protein [Bifidobacterium bohemicum]
MTSSQQTEIEKHDDTDVVLSVQHVGKFFKLPTEQATGLKQAFINWTKGIKGYKKQQVLNDISFEVHRGDFFGIVGRNGSGKSTLLKIISGIYMPDGGTVDVKGKLVPFIELGVGFNPELTGRENVFLNGALLGFTHNEIEDMYDDIVDFAELGEFMDQKLKNYSSGMQVRLAFSVAIKAQGDILVLDEVLAVGDEAFQQKCDDYFTQVKKDPTKTVILVTHSMDSVKKYCNKAILIKDGDIVVNGNKEEAANQYTLENIQSEKKDAERKKGEYPDGLNEHCPLLQVKPISNQICKSSDTFHFEVEYDYSEQNEFYLALALHDLRRGGIAYDTGSKALKFTQTGHHSVEFEMPLTVFNNGDFRLVASLRTPSKTDPKKSDMVAFTNDANSCAFAIRDSKNRDYALLSDRALTIKCVETH